MEITWVTITNCNNKILHVGIMYGKQEGFSVEETQREYDELTTQIMTRKRTGDIVLTGDFNAKLEIKDRQNKIIQNQSRNGRMLQQTIDTTNIIPVSLNNKENKWTRVNRNNPQEKSIIDYILVSEEAQNKTSEIYVDTEGLLKIQGKHQSDHNPMMITLEYTIEKSKNKITKWNLKNPNWHEFNKEIAHINDNSNIQEYTDLHNAIHNSLNKTIGKISYTKKGKPYVPEDIKPLIKHKKEIKKIFTKECQNNGPNKMKYLEEIKKTITQINKKLNSNNTKRITKLTKQLIKEGGVNSKKFWNIRKQIVNQGQINNHDTVDEEGSTIKDPTLAKEHIANFYENLYKAREPRAEYIHESVKIYEENSKIEEYLSQTQNPENITMKEINIAIKKLKSGKATGPDEIPNEALINANYNTRNIIRRVMNKILQNRKIPKQWLENHITRFYKGKGTKGKCSAERGITLSSNMGKLFERIINNRIQDKIQITDEQGGGRSKRSTIDHLNILNTLIDKNKKDKKPTMITFLDVTKAYDKAWIEALINVLYKQGIKDSTWLVCKELNKNLTARIMTQHGLTREIKITDSIRQGGVLSVIMYALLMDEITKETRKQNIGENLWTNGHKINTLLWMDDVALITNNEEDMRKLLETTEKIAGKYRIEFGQEKSKIMIINPTRKKIEISPMYIQGKQIEQTTTYKYLGYTINNKNNLKSHLKNIKSKVEGAYQTILAIMGNQNFSNIHMEIPWQLIKTCIIPIITYAGETWHPNKQETKEINQLLDNIIKRLLMVPQSTPREVLYLETGLLDPAALIQRNRINQYDKIHKQCNNMTTNLIQDENPTKWKLETLRIMEEYTINETSIRSANKNNAKNIINKAVKHKFLEKLKQTGAEKSKVSNLINNENYVELRMQKYLTKLTRQEASIIFKTKTRMLDVKNNYKNKYNDLKCRKCKTAEETQQHILQECPAIHTNNQLRIETYEVHGDSIILAKRAAMKIIDIMNKLNN